MAKPKSPYGPAGPYGWPATGPRGAPPSKGGKSGGKPGGKK